MRNINKRYKITALAIALLAMISSSCLKDDGRVDFANVGNVIEILEAKSGGSTALNVGGDVTIYIRINQAGPDATTRDIVCTLGLSQAGLDFYNRDTTHVPGTMAPANTVTFPETVTIEAGLDSMGNKNRTVLVPVVVHTDLVPQTAGVNFVIPVGIISTSPATTISGNFGAILFNFYKNPWDGWYSVTGPLTDNQAPTITQYPGLEFQLVTVNSKTSTSYTKQVQAGNYHPILSGGSPSIYGSVGMKFTFNPTTNAVVDVSNVYVDATAGRNRTLHLDPTGVNKYDPATKTLRVKYVMHQDDVGDRTTFDETWVYEHP